MREYVMHQASSRHGFGPLPTLVRVFKNWQARKSFRVLMTFDDNQLRDIGLTRNDLHKLMRLPLSADVQWESERLQLISRR